MKLGSLWHHHPSVRSGDQLTIGERAADALRNGMGSWRFVSGSLHFLAGSMVSNGNHGFEKYPFILLSLILSCLAALQGAILLIAPGGRTRSPPSSRRTTTRPTSRTTRPSMPFTR